MQMATANRTRTAKMMIISKQETDSSGASEWWHLSLFFHEVQRRIVITRVLLLNQLHGFQRLLPLQNRTNNVGNKMRKLGMASLTRNPPGVPPLTSCEYFIQLRDQGCVNAVEALTCKVLRYLTKLIRMKSRGHCPTL